MSQLKNDRFLRAIRQQPVDMTPVWVMRQAGRYLPEYRAVRKKAGSFMALCTTPELACEVTLQPLERFSLDAAIIFSDILTIPDAMSLGLYFVEGEGPAFERPVRTKRDIAQLAVPDLAKLNYVYEALRMVRHELAGKVPLIGFCGSPWTLAAYMVEGRAKNGFPLIQKMMQEDSALLHQLLNVLAESVCAHLLAQIEAGAQAVMLFDTWGGMLDTEKYYEFSLNYLKQIIAGLRQNKLGADVPVILFTKGGGRWLEQTSLSDARKRTQGKVSLQGNLNPSILLKSPEEIRAAVANVLESYGSGSGHVFNLGHGITPDVPPENVAILVDAVHELSKPYHA
jgi:uroporphyrinogen decarboxylase